MLARLRCLGAGAALGLGLSAVASTDEPEALRENLQLYFDRAKTAAFGKEGGTKADGGTDNKPPPPLPKKTVALVRMSGTIEAPSNSPLRGSSAINLQKFDKQLDGAFRVPNCSAVVLEMNSPGGSPAQSALLHHRLLALRKQHPHVPLLCYCTDVCASGGYYIASACDEIHVLPSSLVGSIGVVSPSLGLANWLKRHGLEDRTLTAGTSKAGDNPLAPRNPLAVAQKKQLLEVLSSPD